MRQGRVEQDSSGGRNNERSTIGRLLWNVDVQKCIAVIKGERTSWLSRTPNSSERIEAIKELASLNNWYYDDVILAATRSSEPPVREIAAEVLAGRVRRIATVRGAEERLSQLGVWKSDPAFWASSLPSEHALALVSLASVNKDGYARQAALKQMRAAPHTAYLPFILRRLGDWVPQVREQATDALKHHMDLRFRKGFLQAMPEIESLLAIRRVDLKPVHEFVMTWVVAGTEPTTLMEEIKSVSDASRFRVVRFMLRHEQYGEVLMRAFLSDRNFLVRLSAARHLAGRAEGWIGQLLVDVLRDDFQPIRSLALRELIIRGKASQSILYDALTDTAFSMRDQSRKMLSLDTERLVRFYMEQLAARQRVVGGILGLADIGRAGDADIVLPFISEPDRDVRMAALSALKKLAPLKARAHAMVLLIDPNKRIRGLAQSILLEQHDEGVVERSRELMASSESMHRMVGLSLLNKFGGWQPLADTLGACLDASPQVADQAWANLDAWTSYARRLFSEPKVADIERARTAISRVRSEITSPTYAQKSLLDRVAVYLS